MVGRSQIAILSIKEWSGTSKMSCTLGRFSKARNTAKALRYLSKMASPALGKANLCAATRTDTLRSKHPSIGTMANWKMDCLMEKATWRLPYPSIRECSAKDWRKDQAGKSSQTRASTRASISTTSTTDMGRSRLPIIITKASSSMAGQTVTASNARANLSTWEISWWARRKAKASWKPQTGHS